MKRPTLREGWRNFLSEIAIVVIGVLLALGAQQLVDDWTGHSQLREFRATIDSEIAFNLYAYQNRANQSPCVQQRMTELDAWLAAWRASRPYPLAVPIGWPAATMIRTSAWEARTDALTARLPLATRNAYSQIYANLDVYLDLARREREPWAALQEFDGATQLDRHDLMRLQGLITNTRRLDQLIVRNLTRMQSRARALGIVPTNNENTPPPPPWRCEPLRGQA